MNAREITLRNIGNYGFHIGKTVSGKGVELVKPSRYLGWFGYFDDKDEAQRMKIEAAIEAISKKDAFVESIRFKDGRSFNFESMYQASVDRFDISKMTKPWEKDIESVSFYEKPESVGYIGISQFKSNYDSQVDLVSQLTEFDKVKVVDDYFSDNEYDEPDGVLDFDSRGYNGDYSLIHGDGIIPDTDLCTYISGRMNNYNDSVIDDFWNFYMNDDEWLSEVDPNGEICVYHRKGKDWYIGTTMHHEVMEFIYRDEDGKEVDEHLCYYYEGYNPELEDSVASFIEGWKKDCEVRSLISNQLKIGAMYSEYYPDDEFNLNILKKEFEDDIYDVKYQIEEFVDYRLPEDEGVSKGYEKFLESNIDKDLKLFGKYKHLAQLKSIVENEGKKLVYSKIGEFTEDEAYAISYKDEEYHFSLYELYEDGVKKLYERASNGLSIRLNKLYESSVLIKKASSIFVGLEDSYSSGNCVSGTKSFCSRHSIDTSKIGGIRGDALLELDFSPFTRGAVISALRKHGGCNV